MAIPRFGFEVHGEESEWEIAKGAMKGEQFVGVIFKDPGLAEEYRARFPGSSPYAAPIAYDLVGLLVSAAESNSEPLNYLRSVKDFSGASGKISSDGASRLLVEPSLAIVTR